jgi:predicted transcriptional regulator
MLSRILQQPHREQYEIIQQLLQTANSKVEGCKQFELAYESQLNWPRFTYYRDFLISRELLIPFDKEPAQHYEITPGTLLAVIRRNGRRFKSCRYTK